MTMLKCLERTAGKHKLCRAAITIEDLAAFQQYVSQSNFNETDRAMTCEFLSPSSAATDEGQTLLWSAVLLYEASLFLQLNRTKTTQLGGGGLVELRSTNTALRLASALKTLRHSSRHTTCDSSIPVHLRQVPDHSSADEPA